VDQSAEERSCGQHNRTGDVGFARFAYDSGNAAIFHDKIASGVLANGEIGDSLKRGLHGPPIKLPVGLRPRAAHGWTLAPVEQPKLDPCIIGNPPHQPIERIDLAHQMTFAQAPDGGIAGHFPDRVLAMRKQQRPRAGAGGSRSRFAACMAAPDHDDVVCPHTHSYNGATRAGARHRCFT
jgi:hypothetical protein